MSKDFDLYFDWAATSPADEEIFKKSMEIALENQGNPSSSHTLGKNAHAVLEEARKRAATALGVPESTLFFTSGGTESDHIPLLSVLNKPKAGSVLVSSIEHPAIREQSAMLKKCGWTVKAIPADKNGIITPDALLPLLSDDTALVCVMAVNNETGVIQPVKEIGEAIAQSTNGKRKPKFHVDCVQAAGKIPLDLQDIKADSAAFSAHKISGPRGIGILYQKDSAEPFLKGGGQEGGMRSGTENLFGAVAMSFCLEKYFFKTETKAFLNQKKLTDDFIDELLKIKGVSLVPEDRKTNRELFSPYVVQAAFSGIPGNVMLRSLDSKGISISTGSACSAKKAQRPVLEAMHVPQDIRETAVRFSFGHTTTKSGIDTLLLAINEIRGLFPCKK